VLRRRERARRAAANGGIAVRRRGSARKDLGIGDEELVRRYQNGESIAQLAACVGKPWNTIKYRLQAEGVYIPPLRRANGSSQLKNGNRAGGSSETKLTGGKR